MEQNQELLPSISSEKYSIEHEVSVENNKRNKHSNPASNVYNKQLDGFAGDFQKSIQFVIKHTNLIKNHDSVKWLLNKGLSDLNKTFSLSHDISRKLNRKVGRLKSNVDAYETMSKTRNQDLRVAIEQIKMKEDSLKRCNKEISELRCQVDALNNNCINSQTMCDMKIQELNKCNKEISELQSQVDILTSNSRDSRNFITKDIYEMKIEELNKSLVNLKTTNATLNQANLSNSKLAAENVVLKERLSSLETKNKNTFVERAEMSTQTFLSGIKNVEGKKNAMQSTAPSCAQSRTGEKVIYITYL